MVEPTKPWLCFKNVSFGPIVVQNLPLSKTTKEVYWAHVGGGGFLLKRFSSCKNHMISNVIMVIIVWMRASFSGATSPLKQTLIVSISASITFWKDKINWRSMDLASHCCQYQTRIEPCPFFFGSLELNQLNSFLIAWLISKHNWVDYTNMHVEEISILNLPGIFVLINSIVFYYGVSLLSAGVSQATHSRLYLLL